MNVWSVFILNFLINLIISKTTSFFLKENGESFLLSAFFAAEISVYKMLVPISKIGEIICQVGLIVVYVCICFDFAGIKKFLQTYFCYFLSMLVYGGLDYLMIYFINGNSMVLICLTALAVFCAISVVLKLSHRRKSINDFCFQTKLKMGEKCVECKAFLDTGNFLFDPITNKPVSIVNIKILKGLFADFSLEEFLLKKDGCLSLNNAHYIPFKTLNGNNRVLVFEIDQMSFNNKTLKNVMLGVTLNEFNSSFGSDIILHNNFAQVLGGWYEFRF